MKYVVCLMAMLILGCQLSCTEIAFTEEDESGASTSASYIDTCYVWDGHVVAGESRSADGKVGRILLSLYEWCDMPSTNHTEDGTLVRVVAEGYQEMELNGWDVPSVEDAKYLRETYCEGSEAWNRLNRMLMDNEAIAVGGNVRYLCDEGRKSFSFTSGTSISNAGSKSRSYRLRLVKRVE